ncbi:MAG: hypothetical protein KIT83_00355 [Bryobacterales bacterium]|nr:hypothetical protein [Bryobacterales bacterium]
MLTSSSLRHLFLGLSLAVAPLFAAGPLETSAKVYLLRMKSGFDLYLANRLTEAGILTVVTDPQQAAYILTEGVGPGFEDTMKRLYPPPAAEEQFSESANGAEEADESSPAATVTAMAAPRSSSFGRASGTVFLVRRADSTVVWSTFLPRQDTRELMLDKSAGSVVKRLKKWMDEDAKMRSAEQQ